MKNCTLVLKVILCLCMIAAGGYRAANAQQIEKGIKVSNGDYLGFLEYKPADYNQKSATKYPVIIFLHGIGERGNGTSELYKVSCCGLPRFIRNGHNMRFTWNNKTETFLVLSPQCPRKYGMWPSLYIDELIEYAKENLQIDTNRIFLTGLSMGGGGTFRYISNSVRHLDNVAAAATICAPCTFNKGTYAARANLPLWSFHAADDYVALASCTEDAIRKINAEKPAVKPLKTIWPTGGHIVWDRVYTDVDYKYDGVLNIYEWFLGQNKSLPVNNLPFARAGTDIETTTSSGIATLNASGSTDADGKLVRYVWKKLSGPAAGVVSNPFGSRTSTTVTGLTKEGTYVFQLTVVDDRAGFTRDTVKLVVKAVAPPPVNKVPIARAGNDITITLPANKVMLTGDASSDADGNIASYHWSKVSGPSQFLVGTPYAANTEFSNLTEGKYTLRLKVTDNKGATGEDFVSVTVLPEPPLPNAAPVAEAGSNKTITLPVNSVTFDGGSSSDADGTISAYQWTWISGPSVYSIAEPGSITTDINGLVQGTYLFRLEVKDDDGATDADTVQVKVNEQVTLPPPANKIPVARAGNDAVVTLPVNEITLNGSASSDQDGNVTTFSWTRISGPSQFLIVSPRSSSTSVRNLVEGTYYFALQVKDDDGATAKDTVMVKVRPATNIAPVANAGADIFVVLPAYSARLDGLDSDDSDGEIKSYKWNMLSGPGAVTITGSNTATPDVVGLAEGEYHFELTVTDDRGGTSSDVVRVVVSSKPQELPFNRLPVADAGQDQVVSYPGTAILDGGASADVDGNLISYNWRLVSGPGSPDIINADSVIASIKDLNTGEYIFELTVTDNRGAVSTDSVSIAVINTQKYEESMALYPNPTESGINVRLTSDTSGPVSISIYSIAGNRLRTYSDIKSQITYKRNLDVTSLPRGMYYVEVLISGKKKYISKFIKR